MQANIRCQVKAEKTKAKQSNKTKKTQQNITINQTKNTAETKSS